MNKSISDLEQKVMNIVWELKKCSVRDVFNILNSPKKLAYTTVATLLQRLYEKGLVNRDDSNNIIIYSPKISKKTYGVKMANLLTKNFLKSFGDTAVASFADSIDKLPKEKKKYFLQLLNNRNETK
ncbi:MAG: hypothetical protein ACD_19C00017G0021 [uncultured bacterium]|nr:MAG: hypothetical protein ACD_19C00017G0021 [uncultured bacterium]